MFVKSLCLDENSMDILSKQQGRRKENGNKKNKYTQNQKGSPKTPWTHNEKRGLGKLISQRAYQRQKR